jgi:hypothetical protein
MAGHVKKISISVIANNLPKSIRCHSYGSYFKAMVIKRSTQLRNGKKILDLPRQLAKRENKPKLDNSIWKLLFVQIPKQNGLPTSCNIISQQKAEILSPPVGGAHKWCRETGFIYSEGLQFTGSYQHTLTYCLWNASVLQYTIQLYHQWCTCKICHKKHQAMKRCKLTKFAGNIKSLSYMMLNWKIIPKVQLLWG